MDASSIITQFPHDEDQLGNYSSEKGKSLFAKQPKPDMGSMSEDFLWNVIFN